MSGKNSKLRDEVVLLTARQKRREKYLKAAYDLLKALDDGGDYFDLTVHYDDADCDGACLMNDIANELGFDAETSEKLV